MLPAAWSLMLYACTTLGCFNPVAARTGLDAVTCRNLRETFMASEQASFHDPAKGGNGVWAEALCRPNTNPLKRPGE